MGINREAFIQSATMQMKAQKLRAGVVRRGRAELVTFAQVPGVSICKAAIRFLILLLLQRLDETDPAPAAHVVRDKPPSLPPLRFPQYCLVADLI